jgi:hypothetical protein
MSTNDKILNEFELKLKDQIEVLKTCQKDHKVSSCIKCKEIIGCEIRKVYVNAVYQSMNKGAGGGFEF